MNTLSGHILTRYEGEELEAFRREFPCDSQRNGLVRLDPGKWTVPTHFDQVADKIYQYKFRESDIIVNTCPKAGTTWVQEIVWMMKNNPNLDNPAAKLPQADRSPYLEMDSQIGNEGPFFESCLNQVKSHFGEVQENTGIFLKFLDTFSSPRIIKTHLPITLLPPDTLDCAKLVYMARNPMDLCISFYHFCLLLKDANFVGTFEQFAQRFMDGNIIHMPFWAHVSDAWKRRDHPNLHFIFFEDMKQNPYKEIKKLDQFLETNLTEEQLMNVVKFTGFSEMKERGIVAFGVQVERMNEDQKEKEGGFLRKGIVADWKNYDIGVINKMKNWIDAMNVMEIPFKYEIEMHTLKQ